ncbi:response regulator [Flavobacterium sp. M31R6]|uniref:response regulator n=1 Tax=Flavobacterium sp. M31R6 TaxID=2739062 RepID=UPI00156828D8|nr:response regulator [Flavobacterium sp. M31R6]QKJ63914.1 response regulator [Flavobacterium sp. M31R6]
MNKNFIVVDDDSVNNLICRKVIKLVFPEADVLTFTNPEKALLFIKSIYTYSPGKTTIVLLDINMPILSGWDFLEEFEGFDTDVKERLKIYMLSSSTDQLDKDRANENKNVRGYIEKPLSKDSIAKIVF